MRLPDIPRLPLAHLPTPLEPAPRLGTAIGLPHLWMKRDDCTGLAMGGNKARKLEYLVADARAQGADVLLTTGGVQSNHARMTAAAACRYGMQAQLFLSDPEPSEPQGNLLLDRLFGAGVRFLPGFTIHDINARMEEEAAGMRDRGRRPYIIPVGGSTPLGCLGYVRAVEELANQSAEASLRIDAMVVATGSTGTLSGILIGARLFMPGARVYGISVSPPAEVGRRKCAGIVADASELLGEPWRPAADDVPLLDGWLGPGYGIPTPEGMEAIDLSARMEGILLDPVYTGKALAGANGLASQGLLHPGEQVVFWHTGGAPALFAFPSLWS